MATNRIHGIALAPDRVEYTTLEQAQDTWVPGPADSFSYQAAAGADGPTLGEALHAHASELKGPCAIALPAGKCLLRVVDLPTTDPDEIEDMIELQIDKFSPFPVDQLQVGHELLERGQGRSRVLVAAMQRSKIDEIGDAFHDIGCLPHQIDVDALCWWRLIEASPTAPRTGREVLLLAGPTDTVLIVVDQGVPTVFRSLGNSDGMDRAGYCVMLAEETEYALTSMETEWGGADDIRISIWFAGEEPHDLVQAMRAQYETDCALHPLAGLPPLSEELARRAVAESDDLLNLAPPEWEEEETSSQVRKRLYLATGGLLLAWLVALAVFMALLAGQRAQLAKTSARLKALEAPTAAVKEIRDKAQFLERYMDQSYSALETLRELSLLMPQGVEMNGFTFSSGGTISIRGIADSRSPIYQFQEGLQQSGLVHEVRLGQVQTVKGRNAFRLTAEAGGGDS